MQSSRPDLLTVLQIFSSTNWTVFHSFDFPCLVTARCFVWLDLFSSQLNSEAYTELLDIWITHKDQCVIKQFTATHIFKGRIAASGLCFALVLLLWCYSSAYSFCASLGCLFLGTLSNQKISLTWQVCASWMYALNINVNAYALSAVTSCFHNCYGKLKGIESCSFAEAQTLSTGHAGTTSCGCCLLVRQEKLQ